MFGFISFLLPCTELAVSLTAWCISDEEKQNYYSKRKIWGSQETFSVLLLTFANINSESHFSLTLNLHPSKNHFTLQGFIIYLALESMPPPSKTTEPQPLVFTTWVLRLCFYIWPPIYCLCTFLPPFHTIIHLMSNPLIYNNALWMSLHWEKDNLTTLNLWFSYQSMGVFKAVSPWWIINQGEETFIDCWVLSK